MLTTDLEDIITQISMCTLEINDLKKKLQNKDLNISEYADLSLRLKTLRKFRVKLKKKKAFLYKELYDEADFLVAAAAAYDY